MPKNLGFATLLDLYGALLTEKQRGTLELYYFEDLSLAEIAEIDGISRQAVRDFIKRGEQLLTRLEQQLGLFARLTRCNEALAALAETLAEVSVTAAQAERIGAALADCEEAAALYTE